MSIMPAWFCSEFMDQISNKKLQKCCEEEKDEESGEQCSNEENRLFHEVPVDLF